MQLLVIRHGQAEDRDAFAKEGGEDGQRPLTKEGSKKMQQIAAGLRSIIDTIDVLASSPLVRAMETAEIVADTYGGIRIQQRAELVPTRQPNALLKWLQHQPADATVAIVGHEPFLSHCVGWLMTGLQESQVKLKKGSVCLLDFQDKVGPGKGVLQWLLAPRQLRSLAR